GITFLVGEPGIGKSRFAEEVSTLASAQGAVVAWGRCVEGEWTAPLSPYAEILSHLADAADAHELRDDLGFRADVLSELAPVIRERLGEVTAPERLGQDEERYRLFDAVLRFILARAKRTPIVFVLDDLHWADSATIAMTSHLARFITEAPVFVIGTYRDTDVTAEHALSRAIGPLIRESAHERVRLEPLSVAAVGELLSSLTEQDVPQELISTIATETGVKPFFIREVLLHLVEEKKIYVDADGRWTSDLAIVDMGVPEGVRDVVTRRIAHVSETARKLASTASAFDGAFPLSAVAPIAGFDDDVALDALDELLDAQLFRATSVADTYV